MGEWRKSRRGSDRWGPQNRDSNWNWSHARPPRIPDELHVPRWEIEFCSFQGLPWHKLIEAKKFTHLYDNILKWDDSEGEKAFKDSKARFWARINGLESNIPIPGPDKYIDKVNHDEIIDAGIYDNICDAEGEEDFENVNKVEGESVIIWGDFFLTHQTGWSNSDLPVIPTGWGDLPDESNKPVIATGCGEIDNNINNNNNSNNNNNNRGKIIPTGWGGAEASWNMNQSNNYGNNYNNNYYNNYNNNNNYNNGYRWGNENYNGEYGNSSGWNKKRNNGDGNWNWNKDKRWRKKESQDKALFCAPVNGSTRYHDRLDMHRRTVT